MEIGKFGLPGSGLGKQKAPEKKPGAFGPSHSGLGPLRGLGGGGRSSGGGAAGAGASSHGPGETVSPTGGSLGASAKAVPGQSGGYAGAIQNLAVKAPELYNKIATPQMPLSHMVPWEMDLPSLAIPVAPEIPKLPKEITVTLTPRWSKDKAFFNDTVNAIVEAEVPPAYSGLTRLEIRLYALQPGGKRELLQSKDASLSGGTALCELTLFIPAFKENGESPKACEYVFTAKHAHSKETESPALKAEARAMGWLRLKLELAYQGPLANRKCILKVGGESHELTTDDKGVLSKFIPADSATAEVTVQPDGTHPKAVKMNVVIEKLDPPDKPEGARDRLDAMGYGPGDGSDKPDFRKAVEEFQCDNSLDATGDMDAPTQGKLKESFGC